MSSDKNTYLLLFVKVLLPVTIAGFLLFGVTDAVCLLIRLYDKTPESFLPMDALDCTSDKEAQIENLLDQKRAPS